MSDREHEPLTPDERALQQRLARLGAGAEPSQALDARILAAARAPVAGGSAPARMRFGRRAVRWPVGLGLAASLALAVGIAWQLRPLPETRVPYSEAPAAVVGRARQAPLPADADADAVSGAAESAADTMSSHGNATEPAPTDTEQAKAGAAARPSPASMAPGETAVQPSPGPEAQRNQPAEPASTPVAPAPPPPQPSPPTAFPPPPESAVAATAQSAPAPTTTTPDTRERKAADASADGLDGDTEARRQAEALERVEVTGSRPKRDESGAGTDTVFDEAPPASVDSPEVRAAWLARIRELVVDGEIDAARESLREFHRRHPRAELPDDLRPLLD